jgi:sialic acid synthase SpsE
MAPADVEWLLPHVDVFQVGSRNMQNFSLLKTLGRVDKPVLLKGGMMATKTSGSKQLSTYWLVATLTSSYASAAYAVLKSEPAMFWISARFLL